MPKDGIQGTLPATAIRFPVLSVPIDVFATRLISDRHQILLGSVFCCFLVSHTGMSTEQSVDGLERASTALSASTELYEILSTPRRVTAVAVLVDHDASLETTSLARHVAAREAEKPIDDVTAEEHRAVLVSLHHHHLPKLASHRIVAWDRAASTVRFAADAPLSSAQFSFLFEARSTVRPNRLFETLSQSRRRAVVSILATDGGPLSVDELARQVVAQEKRANVVDVVETDVDRVRVSLHHSHLPALSSAGLLQYDPETGLVET